MWTESPRILKFHLLLLSRWKKQKAKFLWWVQDPQILDMGESVPYIGCWFKAYTVLGDPVPPNQHCVFKSPFHFSVFQMVGNLVKPVDSNIMGLLSYFSHSGVSSLVSIKLYGILQQCLRHSVSPQMVVLAEVLHTVMMYS